MSTVSASTPIELVADVYAKLPERVATGMQRLGRPLTLTDKILINHLTDPENQEARTRRELHRLPPRPGRDAGRHRPDGAVAVHDRRIARGRRAVDGAL